MVPVRRCHWVAVCRFAMDSSPHSFCSRWHLHSHMSPCHPLVHPPHTPVSCPSCQPPPTPPQKASKARKRREKRAQEDAEREARIAEELASLGTSERLAEEAALKELLLPLGLGIKDIRVSGV